MGLTSVVIGDPHFKINNVEDTNLMVSKIIEYVRSVNPDFIVVLGDVLDRHETIHVSPLIRSIDFLQQLSDLRPTYVLIGNHDRPNNNIFCTNEHPFTALKGKSNIYIVETPVKEVIQGFPFIFVPYVPPGRFEECLNKFNVSYDDAKCIFAHQEFKGCKMGAIQSKVGDEWTLDKPMVISGHIHEFDELQKNIIYTGTPIQHSFGDSDNKGIMKVTFNEEISYEMYDLGLPKKRIIRIQCSEAKKLLDLNDNSSYKIIISGTPEEIKTLKISYFTHHLRSCKIVYKTISVKKDYMDSFKHTSFSTLFMERLKDEPDLLETFTKLNLS